MSMEKNGAISSDTPSCKGCGCGRSEKSAQVRSLPGQLPMFPETSDDADRLDRDLTKDAADAVCKASTPAK